jgi:hypothetical protein
MATAKEKTKKDPKVVVFGNEVGEEENPQEEVRTFRFRRHRGSFTWGLFFILLGVLFLLSNFGALPPATWEQISKLWPVLIILIGLDTLMGHSDAGDFVSTIVGLFIFGTILGVVLFVAAPNILAGLPQGMLNYFGNISSFLQLR